MPDQRSWAPGPLAYMQGERAVSARSGPVSNIAVFDGVAVNQVGHTTTLSLVSFSSREGAIAELGIGEVNASFLGGGSRPARRSRAPPSPAFATTLPPPATASVAIPP